MRSATVVPELNEWSQRGMCASPVAILLVIPLLGKQKQTDSATGHVLDWYLRLNGDF